MVEAHQDVWGEVFFPQGSQEGDAPVSFLYQVGAVSQPGEVLRPITVVSSANFDGGIWAMLRAGVMGEEGAEEGT